MIARQAEVALSVSLEIRGHIKGGQGGFVLRASQSKNLEHFPVNLSVAG
jgi:hypothetical protein